MTFVRPMIIVKTQVSRLLCGLLVAALCSAPRLGACQGHHSSSAASVNLTINPYLTLLWVTNTGAPINNTYPNNTYNLGSASMTEPNSPVYSGAAEGFLSMQSNQPITVACPITLNLNHVPPNGGPPITVNANVTLTSNAYLPHFGGGIQTLSLPAGNYFVPGPAEVEIAVALIGQVLTVADEAGLYEGNLVVTVTAT